jgi:hypothetical protein
LNRLFAKLYAVRECPEADQESLSSQYGINAQAGISASVLAKPKT